MGLSDPPIPQDSKYEYFPPVMAEEISERVKKIRNKKAGDPDGIDKSNLSRPA
jgi:hypothetical protein